MLTENNHLANALWIDHQDARNRLQLQVDREEVTAQEAEKVEYFIENGYVVLDLPGIDLPIAQLLGDVERVWSERPDNLLAAGSILGGRPHPMSFIAKQLARGPGVRILDLHSHSVGARQLYLNDTLHRFADIIFGQPSIATQTLYFGHGSTQSLHRDPWFVNHNPRTHMLAAWIALEDIHPDSGPLTFVPGSHRLPYFRFHTNDVVFHDPRVTVEEKVAAQEHMSEQLRSCATMPFLGRRGQALIWHGSLIHGGSAVKNPRLSRKSLVVHYGCKATHPFRGGSFISPSGKSSPRSTTEKYVSASGREGFRSPFDELTEADLAAE